MRRRASSGSSSLAARSSSRPARVSHWPVLVFLPPGSFRLSNSNSPSCLRRAEIELVADELVDLLLEPRDALRERAREPREDRLVDLDAGPLHVDDDRQQRPLQRLVDRRQALGGEARLQAQPEPERDVGVLGGVLGRLVDRHAGERLARSSWRRARARSPGRTRCRCGRGGAPRARPCRGRRGRRRARRTAAWCRRSARCRCRAGPARGRRT